MRRSFISLLPLLSLAVLFISGCSAHQDPPATPVDNAATPTNRAFVNSTDQPNTPYYTQPGVNHGKSVVLKPIPSQAGPNQNTPLAGAVHDAMGADQSLDSRYIAVESQGNNAILVGSVPSAAAKKKAETIAKSVKGVAGVIDKLTVSGAN